jgi:hypothetical protein
VDVARQDPRPLNPWTEETKKILIYDPATEKASPRPVEELFRYIPAQVAHYRIFALDHAHDADLAAATRAALEGPGQDAFTTNVCGRPLAASPIPRSHLSVRQKAL